MTREQVLDLYFMEARAKVLDLAAFLDRVERAPGGDDFRLAALRQSLADLTAGGPDLARRTLVRWSDPTLEPAAAAGKSAAGVWPGVK
jgi:hypothetical protein